MPETDTSRKVKNYQETVPQVSQVFFLKGTGNLDWGMKNRMARVFNPKTGRTVMLAVDHGYFQGPTTGLERIDLSIVPLIPQCDALFCTRGILRSLIPADSTRPMVLRASGGPSILKELSNEQIAMDMGRNIFQSDAPVAMLNAIHKVVHDNMKPQQAIELYESQKRDKFTFSS